MDERYEKKGGQILFPNILGANLEEFMRGNIIQMMKK